MKQFWDGVRHAAILICVVAGLLLLDPVLFIAGVGIGWWMVDVASSLRKIEENTRGTLR
jgi:hypothetical protein